MLNLHDVWIGTYTGKKFYPFAPRVEDVDIVDIAHSLAHQCRFNGHCRRFYSVAEHSVLCSKVLPAEFALWGLMHDAAEAYIGDVVRPLKKVAMFETIPPVRDEWMLRFSAVEDRILQVIARRFSLTWPMPPEIEVADLRMLATEREHIIDERMPGWADLAGVEPYPIINLSVWRPVIAKHRFLKLFEELTAN